MVAVPAAALAAGSEAPVVVRLPFVALFALSTWLMFVLTRRLFGRARRAVGGGGAQSVAGVFGDDRATWVLPDGPLGLRAPGRDLCAWCGRMEPRKSPLPWWLLAGMCAGLACSPNTPPSWCSRGFYPALLTQGRWLRRTEPYVAALVAALCCAPIVIWNADHGWASFAFQGGRAASHAFHPLGPLATLAGEALFVGLWVWLPMMLAWVRAFRDGPGRAGWLLAWLATPPIVLFAVVSFWAPHVLFHWAAPGYLMLFPLFGAWAERMERLRPSALRLVWRTGAVAAALGWVLLLAEARVNLLAPFGTDPGLQAVDWTALRTQLAQRDLLRARHGGRGDDVARHRQARLRARARRAGGLPQPRRPRVPVYHAVRTGAGSVTCC